MSALHLTQDQSINYMDARTPAIAEVAPGDTVVFATKDCYSNRIRTEQDQYPPPGGGAPNPATGPLAIRGAEPGDVLAVHILDIAVPDHGTMRCSPSAGAIGHLLTGSQIKIIPIRDGRAVFNERLSLPIRPMIGVIGTAPAPEAGAVSDDSPGPHGGNMDVKLITAGTTLYLPVFVPGANLAMGDVHALMGDGEVLICGVEVTGEITVKVDLIKAADLGVKAPRGLTAPVLETPDAFYCIASAEDLDQATALVLDQTMAFLKARLPLPPNEIGMLMSIVCNLQVCQIVDPLRTVRMEMPKKAFAPYGLRF